MGKVGEDPRMLTVGSFVARSGWREAVAKLEQGRAEKERRKGERERERAAVLCLLDRYRA